MAEMEIYLKLRKLLQENRELVLETWRNTLKQEEEQLTEFMSMDLIIRRTAEVMDFVIEGLECGFDLSNEAYDNIRTVLTEICTETTLKNLTPSETVTFVISLKNSIIKVLKSKYSEKDFIALIIQINDLIDKIGLFTFEVYLNSREKLIKDQQRSLLEVSVPVVKLWDKIIMIPLVGMLDSARTQLMMETLLNSLEIYQSKIAILDISGIPIVDSLVARHLIMTASATKLMGADCIVTGVNAKISQTIVQLGVDLSGIVTRSSLSDGLKLAMKLTDQSIS